MNIHKTNIEWATHTWNPVTGCLHGCPYCYARAITRRFGPRATERPSDASLITERPDVVGCYEMASPVKLVDGEGKERVCNFPTGFVPTLHEYMMTFPEKRLTPARIFVGSMTDLFGEWVPEDWIERVFAACRKAPQHTYLFLTKNPCRYAQLAGKGKLPDAKNFWYGVTATDHQAAEAAFRILPAGWRYNLFLSVEPMLGPLNLSSLAQYPRWVIVGAMTGPGSKRQQPKAEWVEELVAWASARYIPVFLKNNLLLVWGRDMIREHPHGMLWPEEKEETRNEH